MEALERVAWAPGVEQEMGKNSKDDKIERSY